MLFPEKKRGPTPFFYDALSQPGAEARLLDCSFGKYEVGRRLEGSIQPPDAAMPLQLEGSSETADTDVEDCEIIDVEYEVRDAA